MIYQLSYSPSHSSHHIQLDGSKSISNRLLLLQQLSSQPFTIQNLSTSDDTCLMKDFFDTVNDNTKTKFHVQNAGTVARFATAYLATQEKEFILDCAEPMKNRPIKLLVDALQSMGATIEYIEKEGFLPLRILGKSSLTDKVYIDASVSSQYISALMMIGPTLPNGLTIYLQGEIASLPYLEITQACMKQCGFQADILEQCIRIEPGQSTFESTIYNESDWSAAAFYYTISALQPALELSLSHLTKQSSQGDKIIAEWFSVLGITSTFKNQQVILTNRNQTKKQIVHFDFYAQPDCLPAVSVACASLGIEARFTGVQNLVIKESNRLLAMQTELGKIGIKLQKSTNDEWHLSGKIDEAKLENTVFHTYEDHRIAMSLACLAFRYGKANIENPLVVSKSYPAFWEDMKALGLCIKPIK